MTYRIRRHGSTDAFLARSERWLLRAEAEHNLILGIAHRLRGRTAWETGAPFFATVERSGEVVGCVFRTPPFKLVLTDLPLDSLSSVVEALAAAYAYIPSVLATETVALRFAERWALARGTMGVVGMRQRLYEMDRVVPPERPPSGAARTASPADLDLVDAWHAAFTREAGVRAASPRGWAEERISADAVMLWEDPAPRSLAVRVGETPNGARIGGVYTPPEWRGRGYASACVAALSQRVLDSGRKRCFLYTDLSNPTSNSIYRRIGYRPVRDFVDVDFEATNLDESAGG